MTQTNHTRHNPVDGLILKFASRFGEKSKEVERFLKFAVVGAIGFVVDLGTLVVLQATILPPTSTSSVVIATTVAFLAAILSNFIWNRFWTYPDSRSRSVRTQLIQFTFISTVGWLARTAWISLAYLPLGIALYPPLQPLLQNLLPTFAAAADVQERLGTMFAQIIGVVVVMFWNFFANRYWTYRDVDATQEKVLSSEQPHPPTPSA